MYYCPKCGSEHVKIENTLFDRWFVCLCCKHSGKQEDFEYQNELPIKKEE